MSQSGGRAGAGETRTGAAPRAQSWRRAHHAASQRAGPATDITGSRGGESPDEDSGSLLQCSQPATRCKTPLNTQIPQKMWTVAMTSKHLKKENLSPVLFFPAFGRFMWPVPAYSTAHLRDGGVASGRTAPRQRCVCRGASLTDGAASVIACGSERRIIRPSVPGDEATVPVAAATVPGAAAMPSTEARRDGSAQRHEVYRASGLLQRRETSSGKHSEGDWETVNSIEETAIVERSTNAFGILGIKLDSPSRK